MDLIKIGAGVLVLQNLLLICFGIYNIMFGFADYTIRRDTFLPLPSTVFWVLTVLFSLDLIGFMLFAIGLIRVSTIDKEVKGRHFLAFMGIWGWILTRLTIQILFVHASDYGGGFDATNGYMMYGLNSLSLLISGLSRVDINYFYFTLINFSVAWILVFAFLADIPLISVNLIIVLKTIIVPIAGIFAFGTILRFNIKEPDIEKYTTEVYPKFQ